MNKGQKATLAGPSVSQQVAALEQRLADYEANYPALEQENRELRARVIEVERELGEAQGRFAQHLIACGRGHGMMPKGGE